MTQGLNQDVMDRLAKVGPRASAAAKRARTRPPGTVSVSEASERLGIPKAALRKILERPIFAEKLFPKEVDSDGNPRGALIPDEMLEQIAAVHQKMSAPQEPVSEAPLPLLEDQPQQGSQPTEMSLAIIYERVLAEKDSRICDLKAEIDHLRTVLEREQGALARTQALLSLQAPAPQSPEVETSKEESIPETKLEIVEIPAAVEPTLGIVELELSKHELSVETTPVPVLETPTKTPRPFWAWWKKN